MILFSEDEEKEEEEQESKKKRKSLFLDFEKLKENQDEEQKLNFNQQAGKSIQQLVKLIKLAREIPTKKSFMQFVQSEDPVQEVENHLRFEEGNEQEEKADLLVKLFLKKTSVLFDIESLVSLLLNKNQIFSEFTPQDFELTAWMLAKSFYTLHNSKEKELSHYWKNASSFLTLEVVNELLQTFRVQDNILEPVLITLAIVVRNQKEFSQDLVTDITKTMLESMGKECSNRTFMSAFQACTLLFPQTERLQEDLSRVCQPVIEMAKELIPDQLCGNCLETTGVLVDKMNTVLQYSNFRKFFNIRVLEETIQWATSKLSSAVKKSLPKNRQLLMSLLKCFQGLFKQTLLLLTQPAEGQANPQDLKLCQGTLFNLLDFLMELFEGYDKHDAHQAIVFNMFISTLQLVGSEADQSLKKLNFKLIEIDEEAKIMQFLKTVMDKSVSEKTSEQSKVLLFNSIMKFFDSEVTLFMTDKGIYFISLHHDMPENSHQVKEIRKLLMNLKS